MRIHSEQYYQLEQYVKSTLRQVAQQYDENGQFPFALWQHLCHEHHIFDSIVELTGATFDTVFLEMIRLIATEYPALAAIALTQGYYGVASIHYFGSSQQKEKYLSRLISGDLISALGYSEYGKKDIYRMETVATQTENGWIINGEKPRVSNAKEAGVFLVLAKAKLLNGQEDFGLFIVDRDLDGVTVGKSFDKDGLQSMSVASVLLDNVVLSTDDLLGGVLNGKIQWEFLINHMHLGLSSISIGIAVGAFKKGLRFVSVKRGFGKRLIDVDYHQYLFANMYNKVCSAETYFDSLNCTESFGHLLISCIKLYTTEVAIEVSEEVQRLIGPIDKEEAIRMIRLINDAQLIEHYGETGNSIRKNIVQSWLKEE
ncbi:acyl-CoA dehydrogenase family protein [Carnobacteriaceae bacterium zg-ZUI252]|nr:acyl-CoA dehydrogenase family protein [Carnobacteriaceae bacterium zg-ZUI252]MBS4770377.1 acyl-CoA dehydrogenase family protein [Carnobacteriaceae bacterium zg-ZUI240]